MLFLADMKLSPQTVDALGRHGWSIERVTAFLPASAPDRQILALARDTNRALLTQDLDFSALLALGGWSRPSVVSLRLSSSDPDHVTSTLLRILPTVTEALAEGSAITVTDFVVRIHRLPIR